MRSRRCDRLLEASRCRRSAQLFGDVIGELKGDAIQLGCAVASDVNTAYARHLKQHGATVAFGNQLEANVKGSACAKILGR